MHVFHVTEIDPEPASGVARAVASACRALMSDRESNIQASVVSFDAEQSVASPQFSRDAGVDLVSFPSARLAGFRLPPAFGNWLRSLDQDTLLHLHGTFSPRTFAVARECRRAGVPYVFTPHDTYTPASMSDRRLSKWLYLRLFDRRVLSEAAGVQALTTIGAAELARRTTNEHVSVVPNIVEPLSERPVPCDQRSGLVGVGRLDIYQKGLDLLLRAVAGLKGTAHATPLTLIGQGTVAERQTLESLARNLRIEIGRDLSFLGRVSDEEKTRAVSSSRFLVQLSRFEGFGLTVVEALSVGVPPIITRSIPLSNMVESAEAGYIVDDPADAQQVLEAACRLPAADYQRMSERARALYETEFDVDQALRRLVTFYRESMGCQEQATDGVLTNTEAI